MLVGGADALLIRYVRETRISDSVRAACDAAVTHASTRRALSGGDTSSAMMEAEAGIEPAYTALQAAA